MKNPFSDTRVREFFDHTLYKIRHAFRVCRQKAAGLISRLPHRKKAAAITSLDWSDAERLGKQPVFAFAHGFVWYILILIASLLFTQFLRARASHIFFLFILFLFPALLLYTLTAKMALKVYLFTEQTTVEKQKPCSYEFRIINSSIFAYPFMEAIVRIPRPDAVRIGERRIRMSAPPLSSYTIKNNITFRFRGTYQIGVTCFYVYDFFRLFRIRVDVWNYDEIAVLPRKQLLNGSETTAVSDIAKKTTKSPYAYDRLEILDTREYRMGDSLKTVHWKLSSKAENLVVRDYSSGASNRAIIYCDLSARFPTTPPKETVETEAKAKKISRKAARRERRAALEEARRAADARRLEQEEKKSIDLSHWTADGKRDADYATIATADPDIRAVSAEEIQRRTDDLARAAGEVQEKKEKKSTAPLDIQALAKPEYYADMNEFCADGVVELAVSSVLRELRAGNSCTLMWFDARAKLGAFAFDLGSEQDFNAIFHLFATSPLCSAENHVGKLHTMLGDTQGMKQVFITSALDRVAIDTFCNIPGLSDGATFGAVEILAYNPIERFAHPTERRLYIESCRQTLGESGMSLIDGTEMVLHTSDGKEAPLS